MALRESLIRFEHAPRILDARYHFAINIPRGRIQDAAAWLCERHELLAFHDDPDVEEGATIIYTDRGAAALYFLDGGGNIVELIANDHLDNDLPQPFGPDSLLEIAEIGICEHQHRGNKPRRAADTLSKHPLGRQAGLATDGNR